MPRTLPAVAFLLLIGFAPAQDKPLQTTAEATKYEKTSTSAEVVAFAQELAKRSPLAKYSTYGKTVEGKPLPLLVLSDPPVSTPEEAVAAKKSVVIVTANIHAGEVDGKEAVLMLARDLVGEKDTPLLKKLVVVIAPNYNPDGNDKFADTNRRGQNGPKSTGIRANAAGFDLNRDFVKLETPETRGVVGLLNRWNPLMVIDCHTTNGSYHRYTLTYDGPRMPASDPKLIDYVQGKLQPAVAEKVKNATGFDSFTYGDFDRAHEQWTTYGTGPRFGTQLYGLRGILGVLSESYTYASFEDRVKVSYAFVKANFEFVADNLDAVKKVFADAQKPRKTVALRTKTVARDKTETVFGWVEEQKDGRWRKTDTPKDYTCRVIDKLVSTAEVDLPAAYLIPAQYSAAADTLRRHGITVDEVREQVELDTETYTVTDAKEEREFQKHKLRTVEAKGVKTKTKAEPGMFLVRTAQPLGQLAAYLLEPMAEDGLTTWNYFDKGVAVGKPFPVLRVAKDQPVTTGSPRPLPEDRVANKPFTLDLVGGRGGAGLGGQPMGDITWLDDGEHWLQVKDNKLWKVHARTGKAEQFVDPEKLKKSLAKVEGAIPPEQPTGDRPMGPGRGGPPAGVRPGRGGGGGGNPLAGPNYTFNPDRSAVVITTRTGSVLAYRDGSPGVRLTKIERDKPAPEFGSFSPDGKWYAYVLSGNLFAVEVATGKAKQFTTDGGKDEVLNGRADWVYEEEIFNRNGKAYWWSPDSKQVAFLRFDDKKVPKFTLASQDGKPEAINYPKSGQTNPLVKLGVVAVADDEPKPRFVDLSEYKPEDLLISRVGWTGGDQPGVYAFVQNRTQTWLDFVTWPDAASAARKLFRDSTKAWIEDAGEPKFLKDGTFLFLSERSGWKHIYHYAADGVLIRPVTAGKWEVKSIDRIDEASGDVYLTGGMVRSTATHLGLASLSGGDVQVISHPQGTHTVKLAPKGSLYVDRQSDDFTPTQTVLRELFIKPVRVLDTNPVYEREQYRFGRYERTTIPMKDGFELEAAITYPPDFHEFNRYPIWILTYAGPHAPTIRDGWGSGRVTEQVLAACGVVVLRVDPRSASGKGVESAWACYKQMGVQELKDLEEAVDWIGKNSWADLTRVGLSGHSYGGFMASYALTHSTKFSAGIAGAPVTDWNYYDSIYTERYMGLPSENKDGYEKTSVVKAAKNLHGKLLICHGLIDDNVHPQNSLQLISALHAANKEFEVMVYPTSRHGIIPAHYPRSQVQFIKRAFGLEK
jgi:dipeptidyl aminopeptidase/acylaminoacyl peptidase